MTATTCSRHAFRVLKPRPNIFKCLFEHPAICSQSQIHYRMLTSVSSESQHRVRSSLTEYLVIANIHRCYLRTLRKPTQLCSRLYREYALDIRASTRTRLITRSIGEKKAKTLHQPHSFGKLHVPVGTGCIGKCYAKWVAHFPCGIVVQSFADP